MKSAVIINKIKNYCLRRDDITMAFLIGSLARETMREESDIDIAVYFSADRIEMEDTDNLHEEQEDEADDIAGAQPGHDRRLRRPPQHQVVHQPAQSPEDNEHRPVSGDQRPGRELRMEVAIEKEPADGDQQQPAEDGAATINRPIAHISLDGLPWRPWIPAASPPR